MAGIKSYSTRFKLMLVDSVDCVIFPRFTNTIKRILGQTDGLLCAVSALSAFGALVSNKDSKIRNTLVLHNNGRMGEPANVFICSLACHTYL